jgi:superkiller protein 3
MKCLRKHFVCCALYVVLGAGHQLLAQTSGPPRKHVADPAARALNDLLNAAQRAVDQRDFESAARNYQDYLAKKPDDAVVHYDLGYVYSALNRPADAKNQYERAIALDPKMAAAYLNLGATLLQSDAGAAIEPLQKAAELTPRDAHTKWVLGTAFERSGKLPEAIEQYQVARQLDDADIKIRLSLARALLSAGRPADAEVEFRAALTLHGTPAEISQAHQELTEVLIAGKKFAEASNELALYLESHPNDAKVRIDHASLLFDLDKPDDALAELDRASKLTAEDLRALKLRSDIFWKQKRYADAVAVLQRAAALAPRDADISARLGEAYLLAKDYPNAAHWLATSYHLNPNANDVLAFLVDAEYGAKNYAQAIAALDELSHRQQLPLGSWYVRAVCYDNLGQAPQALDAYQKFLQLNKDENSDMYFVSTARVRVLTRELQNKKKR